MKNNFVSGNKISIRHIKSRNDVNGKTFPVLELYCTACAISVDPMHISIEDIKASGVKFASQGGRIQPGPAFDRPEIFQNIIIAKNHSYIKIFSLSKSKK